LNPGMIKNIYYIISKELLIERRDASVFLSSLLYLIAISFVVFKIFSSLEGPVKMGLFWVIFLFTCIKIVGGVFSYQSRKRKLNIYQLYDPVDLFLAKFAFSYLKLIIAGLVLILLQMLFSGSALVNAFLFGKTFLLCALGLSLILSLVSAIASYSDRQTGLVAILSLPLVIPILLLGMRLSLISEGFFQDPDSSQYLLILSGIDLLLLSLSIIFIPLIWKS